MKPVPRLREEPLFFDVFAEPWQEGAAAAPLAALLQERGRMAGKTVGLIISGGNIDADLYRQALATLD